MDQQPTASVFLAHSRLHTRPMVWTVSMRRAAGSADIAAELLCGALSALGADRALAAALARAAGGACRFMEQHSPAGQYHLSVGVTSKRCAVTCADYEAPAPSPRGAGARADERGVDSALLRELTRGAAGVEIRDLQVRRDAGNGLLVAFQAGAPPPRRETAERSVRAERPAEPPAAADAGTGKGPAVRSAGRSRWEAPAKEPRRRTTLLPAARASSTPSPNAAR
ncbi:hypothetical protein [Streptomyces varsoviensis]|nr:hypothetical protein [Streptomyces varsoviensis]